MIFRINTRLVIFIQLFVALFFLAPSVAWTKATTADEAKTLVLSWLSKSRIPLGASLAPRVASTTTYSDDTGNALYHVVQLSPEGFVVVSADDLVEPIIAFQGSGEYQESTGNPLYILVSSDLPTRIAWANDIEESGALEFASAAQEGAEVGAAWRARMKWQALLAPVSGGMSVASVSDERVAPFVESKWNQSDISGSPLYNYYTPNNYLSGCVATAMAQVMRFYQHPTAGVGTTSFSITIDSASTTRNLRGGDGAGAAYDWSSMPLDPDATVTLAQRQAIGALTHDTGVAVNSDYAAAGTDADGDGIVTAFKNTFQYSNIVSVIDSGGVASATVLEVLESNLHAGIPVILGISGPIAGHAIVCDGYGYHLSTLFHHLNMGWSGNNDAWYNLPNMDCGWVNFNKIEGLFYNIYTSGTGEIISGRVLDESSAPMSGVTITATTVDNRTFTDTTDANGIYGIIKAPSNTTFTVSAAMDGYVFSAQNATTTESGNPATECGNALDIDFTGQIYSEPPTVTTTSVSSITNTTAASGGTVTSEGSDPVTARGVCWNTTGAPTIADSKTTDGSGTGAFSSTLTSLTPGTEYYVRAYATNSEGTSYGAQDFLTAGEKDDEDLVAHFPFTGNAQDSSGYGNHGVVSGASLTQDRFGVESSAYQFDGADDYIDCGNDDVLDISGSSAEATLACWFKADDVSALQYLISLGGVSGSNYGFHLNVSSGESAGLFRLLRGDSKATSQASLEAGQWYHVVAVYDSDGANIYVNGRLSASAGTSGALGQATSNLILGRLSQTPPSQDFFAGALDDVRIYKRSLSAAEVWDLYFGNSGQAPTITTSDVTHTTASTAVTGGTITTSGDAPVTERGVCWNTSGVPTVSDNKSMNGAGTGGFVSILTGLSAGTTYSVRAYATNEKGTAYGETKTFTTGAAPSVSSFSPTSGVEGDTLSITGADFENVTGVTVGGTAVASFTVNSTTSITAVLGAGSDGLVRVFTSAGTGAGDSQFTYSGAPAAPTISDFLPKAASLNSRIQIYGERFTDATAVTVGGAPVSAFTVVDDSTIAATVGAESRGHVSVTTSAGAAMSSQPFMYTGEHVTNFILKHTEECKHQSLEMTGMVCTSSKEFDLNAGGAYESELVGDMNHDGADDIIVRSPEDGKTYLVKTKNSFQYDSYTLFGQIIPEAWDIVAAGRYNDDDFTDIVVRNQESGKIVTIYLDGTFEKLDIVHLDMSVPAEWKLTCAGDFNQDGRSDLVFQNEMGDVAVMNIGENFTNAGIKRLDKTVPKDLKVVGAVDFNNDGMMDLITRNEHTSHVIAIYLDKDFAYHGHCLLSDEVVDWLEQGYDILGPCRYLKKLDNSSVTPFLFQLNQ